MKKIFTVLVLAMAMCLAFTGCASKKAKEKGPKTYRIDIASVIGSSIDVGEENELNITSLFPADKLPVAGDTVRVMWTLISDSDIDTLYVSLNDEAEEYELGVDIEADKASYVVVNIPVKEDLTDPVYIRLWSDSAAVCETTYIDAK
ncbi:MAG: hypothetical protein IKX70_05870 [Treponema sp.]|nr:hypothetical protein [Treponema sp.]MBR4791436.1 hypothetical protein [Treponema sp.]MBR5033176.1 hypothetical protein [Treponema sp.]